MKKTYALAFASSLFLLGSCASDAPLAENENVIPDNNGDGYYIRIEMPKTVSTRGDGNDMTTEVNNAAFVFFKANGDYIATRRVGYTQASNNDEGVLDWITEDHSTGTNTPTKCAILQLSSIPYSVECIINAPVTRTIDGHLTGSSHIETSAYRDGGENNNNFLVMSSSSYYATTDETATHSYATAIDPLKNIFTDEEKAKNLDEEYATGQKKEAVRIFVEPVVAKIDVTNELAQSISNVDKYTKDGKEVKEVDAEVTVSFAPEYTFLTAYKTQGYTIKRLDEYGGYDAALKTLLGDDFNNVNTHRSGWVGATCGSRTYANFDRVSKGTATTYAPGSTANVNRYKISAITSTAPKTFYPFENKGENKQQYTSIAVAGKYTAMKGTVDQSYTAALKAEDEAYNNDASHTVKRKIEALGTFYLLGIGDSFMVFPSQTKLFEYIGATLSDKLIPEGVKDDNYTTWTGKLIVEGKAHLGKIIKYNGGYGYYTCPIERVEGYNAIVRNAHYTINLKSIAGMGVGIPDDTTPIIPVDTPDPTDENSYLHIAIMVNDWITVDKQDANFR